LEAFRVAMSFGMDYSELDVHVGNDGDLIVTHDPVPDPAAQRALPRLSQVFELVRGKMGLYVELKGEGTGRALGDLLRSVAADGVRLISGSFVLDLVAELGQFAPDIPRSILFGTGWGAAEMVSACRDLGAAYAHPCFRPIDRALVDQIHAAGLMAMTPHTNDAKEARSFAQMGIDVIASDDPRILLPLRDA
jgi:glycerophosphoryl diester phosphodiesterase